MTDLIEKIGRFFAEQEAQIQESFTQVANVPVRTPSRPLPVHKIPAPVSAYSPVCEEKFPLVNPISKPQRKKSLVRRQLSFRSTVESVKPSSQWPIESINQILYEVQQPRKLREISPLNSSNLRKSNGEGLSWASSSSPATSSRDLSHKDEDRSSTSSNMNEKSRKPRPPQQKNRKHLHQKKRKISKHSKNQEDPLKQVAKDNAEKVAAALVLAQERAKRILHDKLQLERERQLEQKEEALRVQEQMMRIEVVRAKSFRHLSSSTMTTARSSMYSELEGDNKTDSVGTADMTELFTPPSKFMAELETQLRQKMTLEMFVKQSCIAKHKERECVRLKLDKVRQQNVVQSSKVARLTAMKASLEMELATVLEETAQTRQQRRELELNDEKERIKWQREAERELQVRLREEEWNNMMEEEKTRSQIAAEARAKASKRVEARSTKLRKLLQRYRYEHCHSTELSSSSTRNNNNHEDHNDNQCDRPISCPNTTIEDSIQPFKMNFFLSPELAGFEENGIGRDKKCFTRTTNDSENNNDINTSPTQFMATKSFPFRWQIAQFPDQAIFTQVLFELVSDEEE